MSTTESAAVSSADNKGPMMLGLCWGFTVLSLIFVAGRLFVRATAHKKVMTDDFWVIVSSVCVIVSAALISVSVKWGNGRHFAILSLEQKENVILYMMSGYVPGIIALGTPKLAVIALLTRLLLPSKIHYWILWTMGTICVLSLCAMTMLLMLQCSPPRSLWDFSITGTCLDVKHLEGMAFWAGSSSAFLDMYLAVYPAIVLFRLQMPIAKKLALSCALGMGIVSGCVGIKKTTGVPTLASQDVSYDLCDPLYWTSIEGNLVIIAACIPILQPLLELVRGHSIWNSKDGPSNNQYINYSEQSAGVQSGSYGGNYELQSRPKKKRDDLGFTIVDKEGSEENIINDGKSATTTSDHTYNISDGIMKTNVVNVTYDHGEGGPTSATRRWAAV